MFRCIIAIIFIIEICITFGFMLYIEGININSRNQNITNDLKKWICKLFYKRNLFGKTISCFVVFTLLPGILMILILQVLIYMLFVCKWIWKLGDENQNNISL